MKKEEFLNELRDKLAILDENEIEDVISEYSEFIDEKKKEKKKEEKIIEELGDVDELAKEILKAYKINNDYNKNSFNEYMKKLFNSFESVINKIAKKLTKASFGEIVKFIIEIFVICLLISLVKLPFVYVENAFENIFRNFSYPFNEIFISVFNFIIEILYIIIGFMMFITIFKERYLDEHENIIKPSKKTVTKEVKESKSEKSSAFNGIASFMFLLTKIFLGFVAVPFMITFIFSVAGLVLSIMFSIEFTLILGIIVCLIGLVLGHIWLLTILYSFIFNKSNNGKALIVTFVMSLILIGCGIGYTFMQFTNMNYININSTNVQTEISVYTYNLDDVLNERNREFDIYVEDDDNVKVVIDETLGNNIKIEVSGLKDLMTVKKVNSSYYDLYISYTYNFKNTFNYLSKGIKNKEIYDFENANIKTTIYVSSTNRSKINLHD